MKVLLHTYIHTYGGLICEGICQGIRRLMEEEEKMGDEDHFSGCPSFSLEAGFTCIHYSLPPFVVLWILRFMVE